VTLRTQPGFRDTMRSSCECRSRRLPWASSRVHARAGPILNEGNLIAVASAIGLRSELIEDGADRMHNIEIPLVIPPADIIGLTACRLPGRGEWRCNDPGRKASRGSADHKAKLLTRISDKSNLTTRRRFSSEKILIIGRLICASSTETYQNTYLNQET